MNYINDNKFITAHGEFIEVERYPISEINDLIANGLVKDLKTIMMMMYLKKNPR